MEGDFEEMDGSQAFGLICNTICRLRSEEKNMDHRMARILEHTRNEIEDLLKAARADEHDQLAAS